MTTGPRVPGRPGSHATSRGGAAETVGQILPRVLSDAGFTRTRRGSSIATIWEKAVGPELAAEARPDTLRRGVLTVEVRSSALLAELTGFRTEELLGKVLAVDPSGRITGLRFRPGAF
jgi:predicted nucleic acid-binding Zn ribbon protein